MGILPCSLIIRRYLRSINRNCNNRVYLKKPQVRVRPSCLHKLALGERNKEGETNDLPMWISRKIISRAAAARNENFRFETSSRTLSPSCTKEVGASRLGFS